jgi:ABC-2 type transport system permease protein
MGKIGVIISHEYITRIRNKWFIIGTLLGPVGIALIVTLPVIAAMMVGDGAEGKVAILDRTGIIAADVVASDSSLYEHAGTRNEEMLSRLVREESLQAYVVVPPDILDSGYLVMYSRGGSGMSFEHNVVSDIEPFIVKSRLERAGADTAVIDLVERGIEMKALKITDAGVEADSSTASATIGYAAGFVIYLLIFLYGSMVMRGVVEEKVNRIIEVISSSVKPYEMLMGKVVGIGLVGLTQLLAWIVLGSIVVIALVGMFAGQVDVAAISETSQQIKGVGLSESTPVNMMIGDFAIPRLSIVSMLLFVFYFLAGYFIYATLFAAVGSAVDQEADVSQLTFPIMVPVMITVMFIGNVVSAPNSTLSVVLSLIPFFTPILMTVRIVATDVEWWQIALSIILTCGTFFGIVWVASRIYRIGILTYGKKPSLKELARWINM